MAVDRRLLVRMLVVSILMSIAMATITLRLLRNVVGQTPAADGVSSAGVRP